ncbi:MAG: D-2-hydroxyacid dehydrogenase [Deltaproteobacteria bacterium]|nr:D-2-hydroxyacid dehydrogenase [Deltaproteobacteria bacterium]
MPRLSLLVLHDRPDELRATLAAIPDADVAFATAPDEVAPALARTRPDAVFSIKHSGFPGAAHRPAIEFPTVRWFQVGGSGYEHVAPWDRDRVIVTNCQGVLARQLAETVVAAILAFNRGLLRYRDDQRAHRWAPMRFRALAGQTLVIVGVGAIGGELATLGKALGLRVIGVRRGREPHPALDEQHGPEALHAVLARADIVSVHVRATPETAHLLDTAAFAAIKPGALFVNTSRGSVVDEDALRAALDRGALAGAYLDVFAQEPLPSASPWWDRPDVLVTPHAADTVDDWPVRFAEVFVDNVARWRTGAPLRHVVT